MALTTADLTPRVEIVHGDLLESTGREGVLEVVPEGSRLVPCVLRIAEEHAEKVALAWGVSLSVCGTSVHDAQIVDKLNVAFLAIKLGADLAGRLFHHVDSVHLLL